MFDSLSSLITIEIGRVRCYRSKCKALEENGGNTRWIMGGGGRC